MMTPYGISAVVTFKCSCCGREKSEQVENHRIESRCYGLSTNVGLMACSLPFGWKVVEAMLVCPDHDVHIIDPPPTQGPRVGFVRYHIGPAYVASGHEPEAGK